MCDSIIGGTGSYLAELLPLQAARYGAANVKLLMPRQQKDYVEARLVATGIELLYFSRRSRLPGVAALSRRYPSAIRTMAPDIVHAHSTGAGLATRAFRFRRTPKLVFCPHGWSTDMEVSPFAIWALTRLERTLARRADRIVLISRHEERRAVEMGISSRKLVTVANGIASDRPATVEAAQWDDPRLKLLFVGRLDRQKGFDVLVEAVAPLAAKLALRVVGAAVLSEAGPAGKTDGVVEYCGWMNREDVVAQMLACDALVVPSRWEGFGLVAIEAMRLGVPVIGSAVGGLSEILGDGRYGIAVPPGDASALREVLGSLTPEQLRDVGARGRARFLNAYTADRMEAKIAEVYDGLMSGPAGTG